MDPIEHMEEIFKEIDRLAYLLSIFLLVILVLLYFVIPLVNLTSYFADFLTSLITNLIPTILLFDTSYIVIRRFQTLRNKYDQQTFFNRLVTELKNIINTQVEFLAEKISQNQIRLESLEQQVKEVSEIKNYYLLSDFRQEPPETIGDARKLRFGQLPKKRSK